MSGSPDRGLGVREVDQVAEKKITPKAATSKTKKTSGKTAETRETKRKAMRVARVTARKQ